MALTLSSAHASVAEGGALAFTVAATADDNKTLFKPLFWVVLDGSGNVAASGDFAAASGALSPINHSKTRATSPSPPWPTGCSKAQAVGTGLMF